MRMLLTLKRINVMWALVHLPISYPFTRFVLNTTLAVCELFNESVGPLQILAVFDLTLTINENDF